MKTIYHAEAKAATIQLLAVAMGVVHEVSRAEPHRLFAICAVPCPDCKRHIMGFIAVDVGQQMANGKKPKYSIGLMMAGSWIPRPSRRH
jgi:hypothetical protein